MTNSRAPPQAKGSSLPSFAIRDSVSNSRSAVLLNSMENNTDAQTGPANQDMGRVGPGAVNPWVASQRGSVACPELLTAIIQEGLDLAKENKE